MTEEQQDENLDPVTELEELRGMVVRHVRRCPASTSESLALVDELEGSDLSGPSGVNLIGMSRRLMNLVVEHVAEPACLNHNFRRRKAS